MDLSAAVADWPAGRAAVAVIGPDDLLDRYESGGDSSVFWWASVTKLITALAVLDAVSDGTVALEEPAGPLGSTIAHLLAHSSGLPFEKGEPAARPGTRRMYSNYGYEVLADHVAERTGGPFAHQIAERVLTPLGMDRTTVDGSPAKSAQGPLDDLIRLATEFLVPTVLGTEIIGWASTLSFPGLGGILPGFGRQTNNDWGLGCEIRDHKAPHWTSPDNSPATFGHFGQSGSFLWVDPRARLACVSLSENNFGPWAVQAWPRLSTAVLARYPSLPG